MKKLSATANDSSRQTTDFVATQNDNWRQATTANDTSRHSATSSDTFVVACRFVSPSVALSPLDVIWRGSIVFIIEAPRITSNLPSDHPHRPPHTTDQTGLNVTTNSENQLTHKAIPEKGNTKLRGAKTYLKNLTDQSCRRTLSRRRTFTKSRPQNLTQKLSGLPLGYLALNTQTLFRHQLSTRSNLSGRLH